MLAVGEFSRQYSSGLKIEHRGKSAITFQLNGETILACWLPKKGTGIWGRWIRLRVSTKKLLQIANKLQNGPDKVDLRTITQGNGGKTHLLQITTPVLHTSVALSDKPSQT